MEEFLTQDEVAAILVKNRAKFTSMLRKKYGKSIDIEDCYGTACFEILRGNVKIKRGGYPETFIGQMVKWRAIDFSLGKGQNQYKKHDVCYGFTPGTKEFSIFDITTDLTTKADKSIEQSERKQEIKNVLGILYREVLSEQEMKILRLKFVQGLKITEISELECTNVNTVKKYIYNGIRKCQQYIDNNHIQVSFLKRGYLAEKCCA